MWIASQFILKLLELLNMREGWTDPTKHVGISSLFDHVQSYLFFIMYFISVSTHNFKEKCKSDHTIV